MMTPPRVSVVIATYNRSNVLALTLQTILWQTLTDWEAIVVGDRCTDDTEAIVASFNDSRIRFVNLPENFGEQSGPNNEGAKLASGKYLAWVNHDDFLTPDHFEKAISFLESSNADLVFTLCARLTAESPAVMFGVASNGHYSPDVYAPASCWVLKRELFFEMGPWRSANDIFLIPSAEFQFRAWKKGKLLRHFPHLTVMGIASDKRQGSYARREIDEHAALFAELKKDPERLRVRILTTQVTSPTTETLKSHPANTLIKELLKRLWRKMWITLGVHPGSVHYFLQTRQKGGAIAQLRKFRGLPPITKTLTHSAYANIGIRQD